MLVRLGTPQADLHVLPPERNICQLQLPNIIDAQKGRKHAQGHRPELAVLQRNWLALDPLCECQHVHGALVPWRTGRRSLTAAPIAARHSGAWSIAPAPLSLRKKAMAFLVCNTVATEPPRSSASTVCFTK